MARHHLIATSTGAQSLLLAAGLVVNMAAIMPAIAVESAGGQSGTAANSSATTTQSSTDLPTSAATEEVPLDASVTTSACDSEGVVQDTASPDAVTPEQAEREVQLTSEIEKLNASLKSDPKNYALRRRLGVLYSQTIKNSDKAKPIFAALHKEHETADSLMDLASCYHLSDYNETARLCTMALKRTDAKEYTKSRMIYGLAQSRYKQNQLKTAEELYDSALKSLTSSDVYIIPKLSLAGLAGVYWRQGYYKKSADMFQRLYLLDRDAYGAEDIECGWALFQQSQALAKAGNKDLAQKTWERAIWIFRKCNADRLVEEYKKAHGGNISTDMVAHISSEIFGRAENTPGDPVAAGSSPYTKLVQMDVSNFVSPWRRQSKHFEAPGYVWMDPEVQTKAILICVHGLGLHHRSYDSFARRVAKEGIVTIAFDVRGFGTYVDANGQDTLDMQGCVDDLKMVLGALRRDFGKYPFFLLGESMGGALALRVVSEAPNLVDGLICSVPSGSRYKSLGTKLRVGRELLKDKAKPVSVGLGVVKQATTDSTLREAWIHDPSSRLNLSAQELVGFQRFMNQNAAYAKLIKTTPVILFQGHNDKLVKESGTLALFEALGTPEKSIVLIGNTEHLIFEAGRFKDDMTLGVLGWMSAHSATDFATK